MVCYGDVCEVHRLHTNRHRLHTNRHRLPTNRHRLPTNRHRLPTNRHRLHTNRHRLHTNRHRLPTNRHQLPTGRHHRAYWALRVFFFYYGNPWFQWGHSTGYKLGNHPKNIEPCAHRARTVRAPCDNAPSRKLWGVSNTLVQATLGVGSVYFWSFTVAWTRGGGGIREGINNMLTFACTLFRDALLSGCWSG